jgi:hypothetical protein
MKSPQILAGIALLAFPQLASAQMDLGPLNLPTGSVGMPWAENFELFAGTVPPYMALTALDANTLTPDPEAWCNIGQLGPCILPFGGAYNLEMGLTPGSTNYHDVRNAMVLAVDPVGYAGAMTMSAAFIDGGEEATGGFDGIWVSNDGSNWYAVTSDWGTFIVPDNSWEYIDNILLDSTPVDTSVKFYIAFVQQDNFPYLDLDGIGVDDISLPGIPPPPELTYSTLAGGQYSTLSVTSGYPGRLCKFLASRSGGGPTLIQGFDLSLSQPIIQIADVATDSIGTALHALLVPASLSGTQVWLQAVILVPGGAEISNSQTSTVL